MCVIRAELVDIVIDCREFLFSTAGRPNNKSQKQNRGIIVIEGETTTETKATKKGVVTCHFSLLSTTTPPCSAVSTGRKNTITKKKQS